MSKSLALKFKVHSGDKRTVTLSNPKDELTESEVSTAMAGMIDNGTALEDSPIEALSAILTETEKTVLLDNES